MSKRALKKMFKHYIRPGENGCTKWLGAKSRGYPCLRVNGKTKGVSRILFESIHGEIPQGMVVRHTCDNRECLNPDHLLLGTQNDNVQDAKERGRLYRKVTVDLAEHINELYKTGKSMQQVADLCNIGTTAVCRYIKAENRRKYS